MLYNPKWLDETAPVTKPDVFSIEALVAWLEKRSGDKAYDFHNCDGECLIGQYMTACGLPWKSIRYQDVCAKMFGGDGYHAPILTGVPRTFGAALERARSALDCKLSSPDGTEA